MPAIVPAGYTRVREPIYALVEIRHAGIEFSEAVRNVREQGLTSARFTGEELEESAVALWAEVDRGTVPISIEHMTTGGMLGVDLSLLEGIPFLRS